MLNFRPVTIDDKELLQRFFNKSVFRNCDFSFPNIFCWQNYYHTAFAVEDNCLFFHFKTQDHPGYLFPIGEGDFKKAIEKLETDAQERKNPFQIFSVTQKMFDIIEEIMPGEFHYQKNRNWYEYIYSSEDLISLVGKKYQQKRNHINKFKRTYDWECLPITREIIPDCLQLYRRWCTENGDCNESSLTQECVATIRAFENYEKLGLIGGALRINGEILAYSYGQALGKDTFGIHAEKSLYEIDGGFSMINQQFAEHNCAGYPYINREEDLGLESLRKAKLSYHPAILLEKGVVYRS
jgi:hypothetical protein